MGKKYSKKRFKLLKQDAIRQSNNQKMFKKKLIKIRNLLHLRVKKVKKEKR